MKTQRVQVWHEIDIPEGFMLVPDRFDDWRIHFNMPDEETVSLHVLIDGTLPDSIGPFKLSWKEMGGAQYELQEELS